MYKNTALNPAPRQRRQSHLEQLYFVLDPLSRENSERMIVVRAVLTWF